MGVVSDFRMRRLMGTLTQWVKRSSIFTTVAWVTAMVWVLSLAWELLHSVGVAKRKRKKKKRNIDIRRKIIILEEPGKFQASFGDFPKELQ